MIYYINTVSDGSEKISIERNISEPSIILNNAITNNEKFVYVSRSTVFGSKTGLCFESTKTKPDTIVEKSLVIMENNVLNYENGYVIRVDSTVDEFKEASREFLSSKRKGVSTWYPVSNKVIDIAANAICSGLFGDGVRIAHLIGSEPHEFYEMANDIDENLVLLFDEVAKKRPILRSNVIVGLHAVNIHAINSIEQIIPRRIPPPLGVGLGGALVK